ncbi:MAG: Ammonium transporter NrgA [Alphaproteobacteria bacterium MarineAlpha5_Bin6]|nr:MAG: Ammonium transporter NrgA [Alphaproteobacteria bacterium MarineAlpha5_Bin6]|tara:strand:+ start:1666 stop:2952 length:1287 start_codon:yes stop_codon:yes gene_type:complete
MYKNFYYFIITFSCFLFFSSVVRAEVDAEVAYILNTFSFLICGFLVMWMAAGFLFLESGLVTTRSVSTIAAKNIGKFAIVSIVFYLVGYNLGYGVPEGGIIGFPSIWSDSTSLETGYSDASDWFFQALFVCATVSIVSGAVAERIKIWPFFAFAAILGGIIYPIQMGWEWGGGWLDALGFSDFAGSTLVHACGGSAALAGVILLGPRLGRFTETGEPANMAPFAPSSIPLVTLGTFILWMGWYGFNGGSQLALGSFEDATAMSKIFMNTHLAACGGCVTGAVLTRLIGGKTDIVMMLNGALAGLVSITAEPLMPSPLMAIIIGSIGGVIMYYGTNLLNSFKVDDVVGAIPVHMFAGIWGTLIVPFTNPEASYVIQFLGVLSVCIFVFVFSYIAIFILKSTMGLRISEEAEKLGTDKAEIGVIAYSIRD